MAERSSPPIDPTQGLPTASEPDTVAAPAMLRLVAHELRAHLTVLGGYSDLLGEPALRDNGARLDRALEAMRTHISSLQEMSDRLSAAVREDTGRLSMSRARFELSDAIDEAVGLVAGVAAARGCEVSVDAAAMGADPEVDADRFHVVTAVRNLVENACRHGPARGRVRVTATREDGRVEVRVHDDGPGLERLGSGAFRPFARDARVRGEGMGLGLSLVAEVARAHDGTVFWGRDPDGSSIGFGVTERTARTA